MKVTFLRKPLALLTIVIFVFISACVATYSFIFYLPSNQFLSDYELPVATVAFVEKFGPQLIDLGKFFLIILLVVFFSSMAFRERIINLKSASYWSRVFLILCWILLLVAIISDGMGLVSVSSWNGREYIESNKDNMPICFMGLIWYGLAGTSFSLALAGLLAAVISSFINKGKFIKDIQE